MMRPTPVEQCLGRSAHKFYKSNVFTSVFDQMIRDPKKTGRSATDSAIPPFSS